MPNIHLNNVGHVSNSDTFSKTPIAERYEVTAMPVAGLAYHSPLNQPTNQPAVKQPINKPTTLQPGFTATHILVSGYHSLKQTETAQ